MMKFEFNDEHDSLRTLVAEICANNADSRARYDGDESPIDAALWRTLAESGLTGVAVPDDYEGGGASVVELTLIAEGLGRCAAAVPFTEHSVAAEAIRALGSEDQRKRHLIPLARGERIAAITLQQPAGGLTATANADHYQLHGTLPLVPNAAAADLLVVPAAVDGQDRWFVTEAATVTALPTVDRTRPAAAVSADGADAELLGGPEATARLAELAGTLAAAEAVGAAATALDTTARYATERHQFGLPIGTFQAVKHRLADMLIAVENSRSAVYGAAWELAEQDSAPRAAAMAQAVATANAIRVVSDAIQLHGGIGVTWECDLHLYLRRAKALELTYGAPGAHLARIAASLLDD